MIEFILGSNQLPMNIIRSVTNYYEKPFFAPTAAPNYMRV